MQINWNRLIPLLALLVVGATLLIVGALTGVSELLVTGTALAAGASGAIVPTGAITGIPVVPATRRDSSDETPTNPGGVTRRTNRDGFAMPDALTAIVLVVILTLAALAGFSLTGCGGSSTRAETIEASDKAIVCSVTQLACASCATAAATYCRDSNGLSCVVTEELCGACARSYARWCGDDVDEPPPSSAPASTLDVAAAPSLAWSGT